MSLEVNTIVSKQNSKIYHKDLIFYSETNKGTSGKKNPEKPTQATLSIQTLNKIQDTNKHRRPVKPEIERGREYRCIHSMNQLASSRSFRGYAQNGEAMLQNGSLTIKSQNTEHRARIAHTLCIQFKPPTKLPQPWSKNVVTSPYP